MTNNLMMRWLTRFFAGSILLATVLLVSCGDDPEPTNEEELITTLRVTLVPQGGGTTVTMEFKDLDGDGGSAPVFTYSPNAGGASPAALLAAGKTYNASIILLNESETPAEDITEEIEEEADEHLFCFTVGSGANLGVEYSDEDDDGLPVGLSTVWETGAASSGTIKIVLRHQPGTKTGTCPGSGETDIEVTFNVTIQ